MAFNAGSIEATLTLDRNPFTAGLKAARQEAQRWGRDPVELRIRPALQQEAVTRIRGQLERIVGRAMVRPQLDQTAIRTLRERINSVTGRVSVRLALAPGELQNLRQRINSVTGRVPVNLRLAEGTLTELRARLRDARILLPVHVRLDRTSLLRVQAQLAALGASVDVDINLDENSGLARLARQLAEIYAQTEQASNAVRRFGNESHGAFRRADGAMRVFIALMPALLPMLGALVQGAVGLGGALVAAFMAGGVALAAFAAVAIPTFKRISDAVKAGQGEINKLPPGLREAANELQGLQNHWRELVKATETPVGYTMAAGFRAAHSALGPLTPLIIETAEALSAIGVRMIEYFDSAHYRDFVNFVAGNINPVLSSMFDIVAYLTRAVMNLTVAFMPMAQWLLAAIADGMERFATWAGTLANDPAFHRWVEQAKESLRAFWDFLVSVTQFLFELSNALAPVGVVVMDMLTGIFDALSKMPPEWLAGIAGGLSAIMAALLFGASPPVAAVVGVITGLAFAFTSLYDSSSRVRGALDPIIQTLRDIFLPVFERLRDLFEQRIIPAFQRVGDTILNNLLPAFDDFLDAAGPFIAFFTEQVGIVAIDAIEKLLDVFKYVLDEISSALRFWAAVFRGDWDAAWAEVQTSFQLKTDLIKTLFGDMWNDITTTLSEEGQIVKDDWNGMWDSILTTASEEGENLKTEWNNIWPVLKTTVQQEEAIMDRDWRNMWANLRTTLAEEGALIKQEWDGLWPSIKQTAIEEWNLIVTDWNGMWSSLRTTLSEEGRILSAEWNGIWPAIKQTAIEEWNLIKLDWTGMWDSIGTTLSEEGRLLQAEWNGIWPAIKQTAIEEWNLITADWNGMWDSILTELGISRGEVEATWGALWASVGVVAQREWDNIQTAWDRALDAIQSAAGRIWTPIENAFTTGVNRVKGAINGLINPINNVLRTLGIPTLPTLAQGGALGGAQAGADIGQFASGGALKFEHVGPGFKTDGPRAIVGEGNSKYPEYVIPTDPKYRKRAQHLFTSAGRDLQLMQAGGVLGGAASMFGLPSLDSLLGAMTGMTYPFLDIGKAVGKKIYDGASKKIQEFFASLGGLLGGGGGGGGWQWQMAVLRQAFPGLPLISGFRPGAITATGNRSYHAQGRAVDIPPRMDVFNWIRANFGANTRELIFTPAGGRQVWNGRPHVYTGITAAQHYDHVHWAFDQGGWLQPGQTSVVNNTGQPEAVLTNKQWQSVMRNDPVNFDNSFSDDNERVVNTLEDIRDLLERRGTGATVNMHGVGGSAQENAQAVRLALRLH